MNKLTKEDFDLWRLNPVTEIVFAYLDNKVKEASDIWARKLMDPSVGPEALDRFRIYLAAQVDTMSQMRQLAHEDLVDDTATNVTNLRRSA